MAWEDRRGRSYYYAKERQGSKVISRYVGSGEVAHLVDQFSGERREEDAERRSGIAAEVALMVAEDKAADDIFAAVDGLMREVLQAEGFHQHARGQWREKRDGKTKTKGKAGDKCAGATARQR